MPSAILLVPLLLTSTFTRRMVALGAALPALPFVPRAAHAASRLELFGEINPQSGHRLAHELLAADEALRDTGHPICLHIQSLGGDVMTTLHLLDCIDGLACPVWTYVEGYAASAASALAVYGERRFMHRRSFMLLHEVRTTLQGPLASVHADLAHTQELATFLNEVYLSRSRLTPDGLAQLMPRELWLNATACVTLGLVDAVR